VNDIPRVRVSQRYPVPRSRLFQAWTDAAEMRNWFSPVGFTTPFAEAEVRPGGRFRIAMKPPEGEAVFYAHGEYRDVTPPERLVFTWSWEGNEYERMGETLVTVEFLDDGDGSELVLTHELIPDAAARTQHEEGWALCLEHLRVALAE